MVHSILLGVRNNPFLGRCMVTSNTPWLGRSQAYVEPFQTHHSPSCFHCCMFSNMPVPSGEAVVDDGAGVSAATAFKLRFSSKGAEPALISKSDWSPA